MKKLFILLVLVSVVFTPMFAQGDGEAKGDETIVLRLADNQPIGYPTVLVMKSLRN